MEVVNAIYGRLLMMLEAKINALDNFKFQFAKLKPFRWHRRS